MMKAKSATVTIAGTTEGMQMRISNCKVLHPSITAASSSSRGTASKAVAHDVEAEGQLDRGVDDRRARPASWSA